MKTAISIDQAQLVNFKMGEKRLLDVAIDNAVVGAEVICTVKGLPAKVWGAGGLDRVKITEVEIDGSDKICFWIVPQADGPASIMIVHAPPKGPKTAKIFQTHYEHEGVEELVAGDDSEELDQTQERDFEDEAPTRKDLEPLGEGEPADSVRAGSSFDTLHDEPRQEPVRRLWGDIRAGAPARPGVGVGVAPGPRLGGEFSEDEESFFQNGGDPKDEPTEGTGQADESSDAGLVEPTCALPPPAVPAVSVPSDVPGDTESSDLEVIQPKGKATPVVPVVEDEDDKEVKDGKDKDGIKAKAEQLNQALGEPGAKEKKDKPEGKKQSSPLVKVAAVAVGLMLAVAIAVTVSKQQDGELDGLVESLSSYLDKLGEEYDRRVAVWSEPKPEEPRRPIVVPRAPLPPEPANSAPVTTETVTETVAAPPPEQAEPAVAVAEPLAEPTPPAPTESVPQPVQPSAPTQTAQTAAASTASSAKTAEPPELPASVVVSSKGPKPVCKADCTWDPDQLNPQGYPKNQDGDYTVVCGEAKYVVMAVTPIKSGKEKHCYSAAVIGTAP
jgi:hypothetical protein